MRTAPSGAEYASFKLENELDRFFGFELVMDIGRKHDLVFLYEESRCLEPNEQVLGGDDFGIGLTDLGARGPSSRS